MTVQYDLKNLSENGKHGFHIHTYGDLSDGCASMGGHFNPYGMKHGGRDSLIRHLGDFGNVESDADGISTGSFKEWVSTLYGVNSIIGRGCMIHGGEDDLGLKGDAGSIGFGNSGSRMGCGVVAFRKLE